MRRQLRTFLPTLGALALLAVARPAAAGVATSHRLSFQGVARDLSNQPVASGDVRVRIYGAPTGGTLVYDSGSEFNGAIVGGVFNVLLGGGAPLSLDDTQLYHLELDVNGIVSVERERQSPVPTHLHGPSSLALPFQAMQRQSRQAHVAWLYRNIEAPQDEPQPIRVLGLDATACPHDEETL